MAGIAYTPSRQWVQYMIAASSISAGIDITAHDDLIAHDDLYIHDDVVISGDINLSGHLVVSGFLGTPDLLLSAQDLSANASGTLDLQGVNGIALSSTGGDIVITAPSAAGVIGIDAGSGISISGNVDDVNIYAGTDINLDARDNISANSVSGHIEIEATQGDIRIIAPSAQGDLILSAGKNVNTYADAGSINFTTGVDFFISAIDDISAQATGTIAIDTSQGDILINAASAEGDILLSAGKNISNYATVGDALILAGTDIDETAQSGDITIRATRSDILLDAPSAAGDVTINAGNDIVLSGDSISAIAAGNGFHVHATGGITLSAYSDINAAVNNGHIFLAATSASGTISAHAGLDLNLSANAHDIKMFAGADMIMTGVAGIHLRSSGGTVDVDCLTAAIRSTNLHISGATNISGATIFENDATVSGDLTVVGSADFIGGLTLNITGDLTITGDLIMTGSAAISGGIDVTGNSTISGDLTVTGDADFGGLTLNVTGDISVTGDLNVTGSPTFANEMTTSGRIVHVRNITANVTAAATDDVILVSAGTGATGSFSVTLPAASAGCQLLRVAVETTGCSAMIISGVTGDSIEGSASIMMNTRFDTVTLISDGTADWYEF